jgi:hypothetical protein
MCTVLYVYCAVTTLLCLRLCLCMHHAACLMAPVDCGTPAHTQERGSYWSQEKFDFQTDKGRMHVSKLKLKLNERNGDRFTWTRGDSVKFVLFGSARSIRAHTRCELNAVRRPPASN